MHLCELCASISLSKMRGPNCDQMMPHQPSYLALKNSAKDGCRLCRFFWMALELGTGEKRKSGLPRKAIAHVSERYPGRQISLVAWGGPNNSLDRFYITTTGDIPDFDDDDDDALTDPTMHPDHQLALDGVVDLYAHEDDPAAWHGGVTGRALPTSSGFEDVDFQLLQRWLQNCLRNHATCASLGVQANLPTRVLDVGSSDGKAEPYLLQAGGSNGRYIALSHCWGGKVPLTTTTATLSERTRCIPLQSLPKTFREAVAVTRKLGVKYLWIDSLCILQDSRVDWEKEAAVMGDIYASSYLTIAARGSANSAGGLFFSRSPEPTPCRLVYKCEKHNLSGDMYVRPPSFEHESVRNAALDNRGWVLQERLLSPRIIYFGRQQLYWECAESTSRQDGRAADVATDDLRSDRSFKANLDPNGPLPFSSIPLRPHDLRSTYPDQFKQEASLLRWYNIVEEYTTRNLTYQSDKLPALSGIAKKFQDLTGYEYLAGIWKINILSGILWRVTQPSDELTCAALPSWTWARLTGRVRFWSQGTGLPIRQLDGACEMVGLSYTLSSQHNPFGGIESAELQIRGRVVEVTYTPSDRPADEFPATVFSLSGIPIGQISFDLRSSTSLRSFSCLLIHGGTNYIAAIALKPQATDGLHCYERVGYVSVISDSSGLTGRAAFRDVAARVVTIV
ncbi:heterokaryon incompatibility protein-domain-containing protein [Paraphoma chrysanthemicola]|uniref:Heterokaryon incompatibility protein-domain-containing protein n=1 Tax=Paraphoma chrysanthemicola TaxID=798071 RepID=A0A8K0RE22_9PLEO|nr:heterokaryon incompatibility protein-domain-containing protein [Paraphoma chrysanthemicola]